MTTPPTQAFPMDDEYTATEMSPDDAPRLVELVDREIHERTLTIPFPYTLDDAHEWLRRSREATRQHGQPLHFAIRHREHGLVAAVGFIECAIGKSYHAEVGYWTGRGYRGRGIATRAVRWICQRAFADWKLGKISARVFDFNHSSAHVLEECGFHREAVLRKHIRKGERIMDVHCYARFALPDEDQANR